MFNRKGVVILPSFSVVFLSLTQRWLVVVQKDAQIKQNCISCVGKIEMGPLIERRRIFTGGAQFGADARGPSSNG